jgi:8-oxo-dGTP diphosphatase
MTVNQRPEIHQLVMCVNAFVRKDGKYLMLKRSSKKNYAPSVIHPVGGKIELNESPFSAIQREVKEEAGITIKNIRLEAVVLEIKPYKTTKANWLIFHFSADYDSGQLTETQEGKFVFLSPEEITEQNLFPSMAEIIKHILNPKDGIVFATFEHDKKGNIVQQTKRIDICAD